jgi:tRNA-splicing ligase RtcB
MMSRKAAKKAEQGREVMRKLGEQGVAVRPGSVALLSEEAPYAYKDVDEVVAVCDRAGLAAPVARLVPIGVVKG